MNESLEPGRQRGSMLCSAAIWSAATGLILLLVSGPVYRAGMLPLLGGLLSYVGASLAFLLALLLGALGLLRGGGSAGAASPLLTWAAVLIGLAFTANNGLWLRASLAAPPIHDISTDTANPPAFIAILPLRAQAPNPAGYAGEETARQQRQAYPDLRTLSLDRPPGEVFDRATEIVAALGWKLIEANQAEGRIEATDTTFWFGFVDDVVIRIQRGEEGTLVDIRSKSRVGRGDVGTNARRIQRFLHRLDAQLSGPPAS